MGKSFFDKALILITRKDPRQIFNLMCRKPSVNRKYGSGYKRGFIAG